MSAPDDPRVLADGRYAVVRVLGEGAQGDTLEAVDKREGRLVAVKRFRVRGARSWKDVELAEREARVLRELDHPALPRYVEHFEQEGCLYLVMECIGGESLQGLRRRGARLSNVEVRRFLEEAGRVLDYLHGRAPPIVHRDIKPGNVIRREDGSFALVDFGAVRDSLKPEGGSTVVGTFGYMAPEQFMGRALPASDVYAVGATALALLTGCEPEALPHRGLGIDVAVALRGVADDELVSVLERMLEPDPDRRATRVPSLRSDGGARAAARDRGRRSGRPEPDARRRIADDWTPPAGPEAASLLPVFMVLLAVLDLVGRAGLELLAVLMRLLMSLEGPGSARGVRSLERASDKLSAAVARARRRLGRLVDEDRRGTFRHPRHVRVTADPEVIDTEGEAPESRARAASSPHRGR